MLKRKTRNGVLYRSIYGFPKIMVPPNHPFLIGVSFIFTIHFGGFPPSIFGFNIHMFSFYLLQHHFAWMYGSFMTEKFVATHHISGAGSQVLELMTQVKPRAIWWPEKMWCYSSPHNHGSGNGVLEDVFSLQMGYFPLPWLWEEG